MPHRWKYPLRFMKRPPKKVDTVVFANMMGGTGKICESDDWRGDLPRQLAKQLVNTTILVWYNARSQKLPHCFICKPEGRVGDTPFYCEDYFTHTNTLASAMLLVGRGPKMCKGDEWGCTKYDEADPNMEFKYNYTAMFRAIATRWVTDFSWVMNIPVGGDAPLLENYFGFSRVVPETDFMKPVGDDAMKIFLDENGNNKCIHKQRENVIIFQGRYSRQDNKGQVAFLNAVDPADLYDYTVHFIGADLTDNIKRDLYKVAASRGIAVEVSDEVSHLFMMYNLCKSKGLILFSSYSVNPRGVYESLPAGNPVYLSGETLLPEQMWEQPFVFSDSNRKARSSPSLGLPSFKLFMHAVRSSNIAYRKDMVGVASRLLDKSAIYKGICLQLGLPCPVDDEAGTAVLPMRSYEL
mmetsp:Transcript_20563/g.57047  ORF Transcript_20563/g.57047 Transcript_20563/m.57047 type:complete len:409 (+) Transcript_20563:500-1726(+)